MPSPRYHNHFYYGRILRCRHRWAIPNGSFPRGMKVIYRTASGWDHGYMKVEGFADVPLSADCQARFTKREAMRQVDRMASDAA